MENVIKRVMRATCPWLSEQVGTVSSVYPDGTVDIRYGKHRYENIRIEYVKIVSKGK